MNAMPGDSWDEVEFADPREEYNAIDASVFFAPYNRVHLKTCPTCQEQYINAAYLREHQARDHASSAAENTAPGRPASGTVQERPKSASVRPASVHPAFVRPAFAPAPVDVAKVHPLRPETEPETELRPVADRTPPARVPRRRGMPRSRPRQGKLRTGRKQSC
jgi:hypothetical protein